VERENSAMHAALEPNTHCTSNVKFVAKSDEVNVPASCQK